MKKKNIIIISVIVIVVIIGSVFYFCDPLEFLNSFDIPKNKGEILFCFYEADLGAKNRSYYVITVGGDAKLYTADYPVKYEELCEWNKEGSVLYNNEPTAEILEKAQKINPNKYRTPLFNEKNEIANPESIYYIVQNTGAGFQMKSVKIVVYNGGLGVEPRIEKKCKSKYTDAICEYIDEMVSRCKNI